MRKYLLGAIICLIPWAAHAQNDGWTGSRVNKPVHLNINPVPKTTPEQMKCMRRVLLTVGKQTYETSRIRSLTYTAPDGRHVTDADPNHPAINCDIIEVGPVAAFETGLKNWKDIALEINGGTIAQPGLFVTTYSSAKSVVEDRDALLKSQKLHDGTRVFRHGELMAYVLPKQILKTANGEPVVVFCKPDRSGVAADTPLRELQYNKCSARYFHPEGFGFGYAYTERRGDDTDHFGLDVLARKRLRDMKYPQNQAKAAGPAPAAAAAPSPATPSPAQATTPPAAGTAPAPAAPSSP